MRWRLLYFLSPSSLLHNAKEKRFPTRFQYYHKPVKYWRLTTGPFLNLQNKMRVNVKSMIYLTERFSASQCFLTAHQAHSQIGSAVAFCYLLSHTLRSFIFYRNVSMPFKLNSPNHMVQVIGCFICLGRFFVFACCLHGFRILGMELCGRAML